MKSVITACALNLVISAPLLAADGPAGPGQHTWPPPSGINAAPAVNPGAYPAPAQPPAFATKSYSQGYVPPYGRYPAYPREAPVRPPGADWPDAAYGYADMQPPPQPGRPVQVIPPPGVPLEGDIMDTTPYPVRHWRPAGQ